MHVLWMMIINVLSIGMYFDDINSGDDNVDNVIENDHGNSIDL